MVIVNEKFKSFEVMSFLTALAEDVDTENIDETRKNIGGKVTKREGKSKGGIS
jgi:hypothetical protein